MHGPMNIKFPAQIFVDHL